MKAKLGTEKMPAQLAINVDDQKNRLAGYINAKANVARYVAALQNTDISGVNFKTLPKNIQAKLPEDPAVLLKTVNQNLTIAKAHGQTWSNEIQPGLTAIPQAIINYNSQFQAEIAVMIPLVQDLVTDPNQAAKRQELIDLFEGLLGKIEEQQTAVAAEIVKLKQFNADVTKDHGNFSSANNTFAAIRQFEQENITALNSAIAGLDEAISALNKAIIAESVALGASVALIAGGTVGLATAATGVGLIASGAALVVGLIGVGLSAGFLISSIEKVQKAKQEEAFDKLEVSQLTVQVQMLDTTEKALSALVLQSQTAIASIQVILDIWATLSEKIKAVVADLKDSENAIGNVMSIVDLTTAQTQWSQLQTFAEQMQDFEQKIFANPPVKLTLKPMVVKMAA